jgi:site-specific recombinase XerD
LTARTSAANSRKHHRNLQQFFRWLVSEGELDVNPMMGIRPPKVPEQLVAVFTNAELTRMLSACKGNSFLQRRNAALVRVLMDTGIRAAELCGMQLGDVDLDIGLITVMGKGRRVRSVPISAKTSEAISRYLRQRNRHPYAALSSLWLSNKGALTTSGLWPSNRQSWFARGLKGRLSTPLSSHGGTSMVISRWWRAVINAHHGLEKPSHAWQVWRQCSGRAST